MPGGSDLGPAPRVFSFDHTISPYRPTYTKSKSFHIRFSKKAGEGALLALHGRKTAPGARSLRPRAAPAAPLFRTNVARNFYFAVAAPLNRARNPLSTPRIPLSRPYSRRLRPWRRYRRRSIPTLQSRRTSLSELVYSRIEISSHFPREGGTRGPLNRNGGEDGAVGLRRCSLSAQVPGTDRKVQKQSIGAFFSQPKLTRRTVCKSLAQGLQ